MAERKQYRKPVAINLSDFGAVGYEAFDRNPDGSEQPIGSCNPRGGIPSKDACIEGSHVSIACLPYGSVP